MMSNGPMHIDTPALNRLMPMHLWISGDGIIESAGGTLRKVFGVKPLAGSSFFEMFEVRRPGGVFTVADMRRLDGERLQIMPKEACGVQGLRGIAVSLPDTNGVLVNLSFGIGVIKAVAAHDLTDADFAATDLAMELLYLVEAKTAVTAELRELNLRLKGARDAAEEQALTDTLTGLRNRRALDLAMSMMIDHKLPFGLMHIDLDYFKSVNDSLGHAAGDFVLQEVAKVLTAQTRTGDTVARVGGDEFVVVFRELTDSVKLFRIAERVVAKLTEPYNFQGQTCHISASIGITISTDYARPLAEKMLSDADQALYASKNAGRGRAKLHSVAMAERTNS
jgi:diguanylate cyclase (GGDEF)-like protein